MIVNGVSPLSPPDTPSAISAHRLTLFSLDIQGLARSLAIDLAPVRVNVVYPGAVETPLWDGVPEEQRQGMFREFEKKILTGSIGKPEEVAEAYLYTMRS